MSSDVYSTKQRRSKSRHHHRHHRRRRRLNADLFDDEDDDKRDAWAKKPLSPDSLWKELQFQRYLRSRMRQTMQAKARVVDNKGRPVTLAERILRQKLLESRNKKEDTEHEDQPSTSNYEEPSPQKDKKETFINLLHQYIHQREAETACSSKLLEEISEAKQTLNENVFNRRKSSSAREICSSTNISLGDSATNYNAKFGSYHRSNPDNQSFKDDKRSTHGSLAGDPEEKHFEDCESVEKNETSKRSIVIVLDDSELLKCISGSQIDTENNTGSQNTAAVNLSLEKFSVKQESNNSEIIKRTDKEESDDVFTNNDDKSSSNKDKGNVDDPRHVEICVESGRLTGNTTEDFVETPATSISQHSNVIEKESDAVSKSVSRLDDDCEIEVNSDRRRLEDNEPDVASLKSSKLIKETFNDSTETVIQPSSDVGVNETENEDTVIANTKIDDGEIAEFNDDNDKVNDCEDSGKASVGAQSVDTLKDSTTPNVSIGIVNQSDISVVGESKNTEYDMKISKEMDPNVVSESNIKTDDHVSQRKGSTSSFIQVESEQNEERSDVSQKGSHHNGTKPACDESESKNSDRDKVQAHLPVTQSIDSTKTYSREDCPKKGLQSNMPVSHIDDKKSEKDSAIENSEDESNNNRNKNKSRASDTSSSRAYQFTGFNLERAYTLPELVPADLKEIFTGHRDLTNRERGQTLTLISSPKGSSTTITSHILPSSTYKSCLPLPPVPSVKTEDHEPKSSLKSPNVKESTVSCPNMSAYRDNCGTSSDSDDYITDDEIEDSGFLDRKDNISTHNSIERSEDKKFHDAVSCMFKADCKRQNAHMTYQDMPDREKRVIGLYNELKCFSLLQRSKENITIAMSSRANGLSDLHIEWGSKDEGNKRNRRKRTKCRKPKISRYSVKVYDPSKDAPKHNIHIAAANQPPTTSKPPWEIQARPHEFIYLRDLSFSHYVAKAVYENRLHKYMEHGKGRDSDALKKRPRPKIKDTQSYGIDQHNENIVTSHKDRESKSILPLINKNQHVSLTSSDNSLDYLDGTQNQNVAHSYHNERGKKAYSKLKKRLKLPPIHQ